MSRAARQQSNTRRLVIAFAGIGVIHAVALGALSEEFPSLMGGAATDRAADDIIANATPVTMMSSADVDTLSKQIDAETEKKLEEAKKTEAKTDEKGQVVDLPKPSVEIRPDKADYLSEYDTVAQKQTKARQNSSSDAGRAEKQPPRISPPPRPTAATETQQPRGTGTGKTAPGAAGGDASARPDGFGEPEKEGGTLPKKGMPGSGETVGKGDGRPLPKLGDLRPRADTLERAAGGGGVSDYLKDVEDGDETVLNSKRWKFASFFNRMKNQVAQHWHPDVAYRLRDPSGKIYGTRNRLTILRVTLSPGGDLKDIFLEKSSEVGFLDDEAESAFRAAEPFPNPPPQLVNADSGTISFRFGFLFEITSAPRFRVFRYND